MSIRRFTAALLALLALAAPPAIGGEQKACDEKELLERSKQCLRAPADALKKVPADAALSASIEAKEPWNCTGVLLEKGVAYEISSRNAQDWKDKSVRADVSTGWLERRWLGNFFQWRARSSGHPMYSLLGAVAPADGSGADPQQTFLIGRRAPFVPERDGQLVAFANDVSGYYCNNHGRVTVSVKRANVAPKQEKP